MTRDNPAPRDGSICVVGSGTAFVSGISYYTYFLAQSLSSAADVSVVLMRRLIPRFLYPGRARVATAITPLHAADIVPTFDGVDWWGAPSIWRAIAFVKSAAPETVIFQWWSGSVLPWYLLIARAARRNGSRIVLEFHEDLDTGEARIPVVGPLVLRGIQRLIAQADGFVVHSDWDRARLTSKLGLAADRVAVIPHGPFPMASGHREHLPTGSPTGAGATTILFFGTIRPYKGLEDLVRAFELLPRTDGQRWRLLVVGETWEGWTLPLELIANSPYSADVEVINRYVVDDEIPGLFARADVVALPYLRSSASGPLALSMTAGLPVVVTDVGGLTEAAQGYSGAILVEPGNAAALADGLVEAIHLVGRRHDDVRTWDGVARAYRDFVDTLTGRTEQQPLTVSR